MFSGGKPGFVSEENVQTATIYMALKMYGKDYQAVIKKKGVKGIPPFSSLILLFENGERLRKEKHRNNEKGKQATWNTFI